MLAGLEGGWLSVNASQLLSSRTVFLFRSIVFQTCPYLFCLEWFWRPFLSYSCNSTSVAAGPKDMQQQRILFFQGNCFFEYSFFASNECLGLQSHTCLPNSSDHCSSVILQNLVENKEAFASISAVRFLAVHVLSLM